MSNMVSKCKKADYTIRQLNPSSRGTFNPNRIQLSENGGLDENQNHFDSDSD